MTTYADTNFFTRLYLARPGSDEAQAIFRQHKAALPITWLLRLELINSFEQSVLTGFGEAQSRITTQWAAVCQQQFREDLHDAVALRMVDVPLREVTRRFESIALKHTAKHGFRTYDILHVASALALGCKTFWSFDKKASKLAKLEGLKTL